VTHLHIPDGVLPAWLWGAGWLATALALLLGWRTQRRRRPGRVAYEGFLGALMLAAMALEIPLGPIEYHLSLAGPIGVLLGPAGVFQAAFIASTVLAFVGHGGFTLIGLNAANLGLVGALAAVVYRARRATAPAPVAMATATALGQLAGGAVWAVLLLAGARARALDAGLDGGRAAWLGGVAVPIVLAGVAAETLVAYGLGRFLARVRPDLLETPDPAAAARLDPSPR
jgi:cobalt/nickel transport system permease protein